MSLDTEEGYHAALDAGQRPDARGGDVGGQWYVSWSQARFPVSEVRALRDAAEGPARALLNLAVRAAEDRDNPQTANPTRHAVDVTTFVEQAEAL